MANSELIRFANDLGKIAGKVVPEVDAVLKKGANNIKEELIADVKRSRHFSGKRKPSLEAGISYDPIGGVGSLGYEIGPEIGRAGGSLGHIYYLGTSRGGGTGDIEGPLNNEKPNIERELGKLVDRWGDALE